MAGYSTALRNARLQAIVDALGAGGTLTLYTSPRPATGGTATGTVLSATPLKNPVGTISSGQLTFTKPDDVQATGAGTATWARLTNGGTFVADLSVSDTSGSGEVKLNVTSITVGLWISVQSMICVEGNA